MLGVCCQWLEPKNINNTSFEISSFKNIMNEQSLQFGRFNNGLYSNDKILSVWKNNVDNLYDIILNKVIPSKIRMFRVSSNLFPLFDKCKNLLDNNIYVKTKLKQIGDLTKSYNMRITTHPDQFNILNSNKPQVIANSINNLKHHAWVFDCMGFEQSPYYAINIHGGVKGNFDLLVSSINSLDDNVKNRLTLENDERSFNVSELFEVYNKTNIPVLLDTHHFNFNSGNISLQEAFDLSFKSWRNIKPLTHLSNTEPGMENASFNKKRSHSRLVGHIPELQKNLNNSGEIDIEMEFKLKNIAVFDALQKYDIAI